MKDLGNTIYAFGCVAAATVLGIGFADYWFGHHQLTAFPLVGGIGGHSLASRPRIFVRSGFVGGRSPHWIKVKNPNAPAVAEEDWGR